ncbi:MAG: RraA family protein [Aquiluna sp.]|nr:RraA family protein [Aquiluna sp.]
MDPVNIARGLKESDLSITSAIFSDSMDKCGFREGVALSQFPPSTPDAHALGRARTAMFVPSDDVDPSHPYDDMIDFIDGTQPGDLLVIATSESNASAFWGELFSAAALARGATGMITDGNIRDVEKVISLGFATFARSHRPVDFRGRMVLHSQQQVVQLGGVSISPGDLVCADLDGIVVVPPAAEDEVLSAARERAAAETSVLAELLAGSTLREVWTRHGVL